MNEQPRRLPVAGLEQLSETDRLIYPKTEGKKDMLRRIANLVNLNALSEQNCCSEGWMSRLSDFSVYEVIKHLIEDQSLSAFSIESVRAIMQNKVVTIVTYPGEHYDPTELTKKEGGLIALINMNLLKESPEEYLSPSVIIEYMSGRPFTLQEITDFLNKGGFQYELSAVKVILKESRTAFLVTTKPSSKQLRAPKTMDSSVTGAYVASQDTEDLDCP
jgi:hypothetical protein